LCQHYNKKASKNVYLQRKKVVYYDHLLANANKAGNDLYNEIKMLVEPLRDGSKYVRSILEVVQKAGGKGI
jgi:hypothetical protein